MRANYANILRSRAKAFISLQQYHLQTINRDILMIVCHARVSLLRVVHMYNLKAEHSLDCSLMGYPTQPLTEKLWHAITRTFLLKEAVCLDESFAGKIMVIICKQMLWL